MKKILLLSSMVFSLGAFAQGTGAGNQQSEAFSPNDGLNPPGTFAHPNKAEPIEKQEQQKQEEVKVKPEGRSPTTNSSGVKPEESSSEAIKTIKSDRVYQTGPYNREGQYAPKTDEQKQAEEERDAHLKEMEQEKKDLREQEEAVK